jgi:hypothetical protein
MAKAQATIRVKLELGTPRPGAWCDICLLPAAATWPLIAIYPAGVLDLGEITACPTHVDLPAVLREAADRGRAAATRPGRVELTA